MSILQNQLKLKTILLSRGDFIRGWVGDNMNDKEYEEWETKVEETEKENNLLPALTNSILS